MRKRIILGLLSAGLVFGAVTGLAASLTVNAGELGSGTGTVSACDTTVSNTYTLVSGTNDVSHVVVTGIADPGCDGTSVAVQVLNSADAVLGHGTAAHTDGDTDTTDNSQSVALNTNVDSASIAKVLVTLNG